MVFINIAILVLGLALLIKGAGYFIKSAASIAKKFGVSEFVIGLTVVALGTSIPELANAIVASFKHQGGIIIGNIVGANVSNIGLVIGLSAAIAIIKTNKQMLKRDGYIMLFAAIIFYFFISNKTITNLEGIIFLLLYLAYIMFLFSIKPKIEAEFRDYVRYFIRFDYLSAIKSRILSTFFRKALAGKKEPKTGLFKDLLILTLGGVAIVFGSSMVINKAIFFAEFFNVPKMLIGVLLALGTTLPELMVSVSATTKGHGNMALGNILGSNITNIFLILGVSAIISPISISELTLFFAAPYMIAMSFLLLVFIKSNWNVRRAEGIVFLILYALFLVTLFLLSLLH